jgi:hypothetical protein
MSHLTAMLLYALLLGVFLATLWRRDRRAQVKLFLQIFCSLVLGAVALGWLMYFLPSGPPAPIP